MASDRDLIKVVAIKIIDTSKIKDVKYVTKNLYREADILCSLAHPGIMYLYETFQHGPLYFLVTEVLEGGDLCAYMKRQRNGRLDERTTRRFARQIVSALAHMHQRGIVHRDLKMENIMMDAAQQHVKIVDFGLSHSWCPGETLETHCGSPEYAAPELFNPNARYGAGVDLWSIGVVLFGMATGRLPFMLPASRLLSAAQRREQLLTLAQRGFHSSQERALMHMSAEFRNVVRLLLTVDMDARLTVEGLLSHPWITCRQAKMIAECAYKPLAYEDQDKVIRQISDLLHEPPAQVANAIKLNCLGKEAGMYNILFHKRAMGACVKDRFISDEIRKVKIKLATAGAGKCSSKSLGPRIPVTPSKIADVKSRQSLSFRTKTEELLCRAQKASSKPHRPSTTLFPYVGPDSSRVAGVRSTTVPGTQSRNVGPSSKELATSARGGGGELAAGRRDVGGWMQAFAGDALRKFDPGFVHSESASRCEQGACTTDLGFASKLQQRHLLKKKNCF